MPRLTTIDPDNATGRARELFEGPLKDKKINIFKGMANSPAALDIYLGMSQGLGKSSLSPAEQETVHLAISQANGCDYCLAAHTMLGKGAGLSEDQTVAARKQTDMGDPKLSALARFATALHEKKGYVSDRDLEQFKSAGYDDGAVVDTLAVYALATFTNYFNHVNETDVAFPAPPGV